MAKRIVCLLMGHRVKRREVYKHDGTYVGRCRRCKTHMEKRSGSWVADRSAA